MSARTDCIKPADEAPDWRAALRDAVRDPAELARLLELPESALAYPAAADGAFPLLVPRGFVARMRKRDPADPLLRQVLPAAAEAGTASGFGPDPLAEHGLARHGCIRKYPGRILLITTGACPVHCRYCFRREFPYSAQTAGREDWRPALETIAASPELTEVILSGGDPLSLGNRQLERLISAIARLPHIKTLRIHTRFPIVLPERVDSGLIDLLSANRLTTILVVHANHPAEIDATVAGAAARLRPAVALLLNQAVLLRGINDDASILLELGQRLTAVGIAPYYLHLLDRVNGTAHFEVAEARAIELMESLRQHAPGYLVPKLVRDRSGELSKTPVA